MKRTIFLVVVFVFVGFLAAFFLFKFLTAEKPAAIPVPSLSAVSQAPSPKPVQSTTQPQKDIQQSLAANMDTSPKSNAQVILHEKKQDTSGKIQEAEKKELPTLILNGIFSGKGDNFALINNRIVKEGDSISGVKVLHIYPNKVELDANGQNITLRVK